MLIENWCRKNINWGKKGRKPSKEEITGNIGP